MKIVKKKIQTNSKFSPGTEEHDAVNLGQLREALKMQVQAL